MKFERITSANAELYPAAMELYRISFPLHEQREAASQAQIMGCGEYHFNAIYEAGQFIGLMLYWETPHFIYVEHFCILPAMRNNQYGRKALDQLKQSGKVIILEIDPPVDEVSIRRRGFYERAGFQENPYEHYHPAYRARYAAHRLAVMSYPDLLPKTLYGEFANYLGSVVMKSSK